MPRVHGHAPRTSEQPTQDALMGTLTTSAEAPTALLVRKCPYQLSYVTICKNRSSHRISAAVNCGTGAPRALQTPPTSLSSKGQIPLRYPGRKLGRRPVASWNLAYRALSSSLVASQHELAGLRPAGELIADLISDLSQTAETGWSYLDMSR